MLRKHICKCKYNSVYRNDALIVFPGKANMKSILKIEKSDISDFVLSIFKHNDFNDTNKSFIMLTNRIRLIPKRCKLKKKWYTIFFFLVEQ